MPQPKLKVWEYPKGSGIKIRERINNAKSDGSHSISYRISIPTKITGRASPIIKQFKTKEEAFTWGEQQRNNYLNLGIKAQELSFKERLQAIDSLKLLSHHDLELIDVVKEYIEAIETLDGSITLIEAAKFAKSRLSPEGGERTIQQIVNELLKLKNNSNLRERTIKDFTNRSQRICKTFSETPVKFITAEEIKTWAFELNLSTRSRINYLSVFGEIISYAIQKKYLLENPLDSLSKQDWKSLRGSDEDIFREPNILTVDQAKNLIETAFEHPELDMRAVITLGLFCGIRTEELKRMDWEEIHLDDQEPFLVIPATKAKKRRIRNVPIPPNAVKWLQRCRKKSGPITDNRNVSSYQRKFYRLLKHAEFGEFYELDGKPKWRSLWEENNMRHSFGSYDYALYGDPIRTAGLLGHKATDDVLFEHYRALTNKKNAEKYFSITP